MIIATQKSSIKNAQEAFSAFPSLKLEKQLYNM